MPRPKPEIEPVQIAVRLSPKLLADLDAECALSEKSRNGVIAYALQRFFGDQAETRRRVADTADLLARAGDPRAQTRGLIAGVPDKEHLTMADVRPPVDYGALLKRPKGKAS